MQEMLLGNRVTSEYFAIIQRQTFVDSIHLFVVHKLAVVIRLVQLWPLALICRMPYSLLILRILHRAMIILEPPCCLLLCWKYLVLQSCELLICLLTVHVGHVVSELLLDQLFIHVPQPVFR